MAKIIDYSRKGVILYGGQGKKCPYCPCYFLSNIDYDAHMPTHWIKSTKSNGEWLRAELDPTLREQLRIVGKLVMNGYRYSLIGDGTIIYRVREQTK